VETVGGGPFHKISIDTFELLSDWVHYAILSLLELPDSRLNSRWIARRLGVSELQARLAIERLKRLHLIARINGKWKQSSQPLIVENDVPSLAIKRHHRHILQKADEALDTTTFKERDFSATTFTADPKNVPFAMQKIRAFRRKLVAELEKMGRPSEVYQIAVQLFPISRKAGQ